VAKGMENHIRQVTAWRSKLDTFCTSQQSSVVVYLTASNPNQLKLAGMTDWQ
jgi:hypothetical protein